MKIGLNYWTLGGFEGKIPIADAARDAKSAGLDAMELCFGAGELTPETCNTELDRIRSAVIDAGLDLQSLATAYYWSASLGSPDDAERNAATSFTEAYIRAAGRLRAPAVLVMPGTVDVGWDPKRPVAHAKQVYDLSRRSLESLLPVAEGEGVTTVENVWGKFLTGPFEFCAYVDTFYSKSLKAYFDVGNVVLNGYPEHWIDILGPRIARVHFKNFRRRDAGGTLGDFTASLLDGDVNWAAVFEALARAGYDEYVTAEMLVSETPLPNRELAFRAGREMALLRERHVESHVISTRWRVL